MRDIYQSNLLASATAISLQDNDQLSGIWDCKWKIPVNRIIDKAITLKIDKSSGRSFKCRQTLASPQCARNWPLRGKITGNKLSYTLSPATATSAASCKFSKRYEGELYEINKLTKILDLKFYGIGYHDNGQMRCTKQN